MTPEQEKQFNQMMQEIQELKSWKEQKMKQQISFPLDEASRNTIGGFGDDQGAGATLKTLDINLTGNAQTITVPALYVRTRTVVIGGVTHEIPSIV